MSNEAITLTWYALESGILSPTEGLLLLRLADFADESWSCFPSQDLLEVQTNQKNRTVRAHLARLRELNLVRTEDRRNGAGHRVGLRYYLNHVLMEEIRSSVVATRAQNAEQRRMQRKAESERKRGKSDDEENPGMTRPADIAGRFKNPGMTRPADSAGRGSLPAESCTNSEGAFKRNTRAINHQQQLPRSTNADEARQAAVAPDPDALIEAWVDVDDSKLVHRGVDVLGLASFGAKIGIRHTIELWHRVIDLVLDRANGDVKNPNAYVTSAFTRSSRALILEATQALEKRSKAPDEAAGAPKLIECDLHSWSGPAGAQCPSCRADALVGKPADEATAVVLTDEEIQKLPEQYRHMVAPNFRAPISFENTPSFQQTPWVTTDHESVAPWDREDRVRP